MHNTVINIEKTIEYIETHLNEKLNLEKVSDAMHYSKYHLHRLFINTVGISIHAYITRRQLTEAANLLIFSNKSIIEIALNCGYKSQQAFTLAFKSMYKITPAKFRENKTFYPLQLRFKLHTKKEAKMYSIEDISIASRKDIKDWMNLMKMVIDGYPYLIETEYLNAITKCINKKEGLVLKDGNILVGALAFSYDTGSIDFIGIHPQYRNIDIYKVFINALLNKYLPGKQISITTYRENDKADTGYRVLIKQLGFIENELLIEFGYPTQRFILPYQNKECKNNA